MTRLRPGAVLAATVTVAMILLALPVVPVSARVKTFYGVTPDLPTGGHVHRPPRARAAANLPYGGGPVLHFNRTHVIFWQPAGSGLGYDPGYQLLVQGFLANVAADSHKPTNVYGLSGQYGDSQGAAAYASTYGGSVTAIDPLPVNGCEEPPPPPLGTGPPDWNVCLSDGQLSAEVQHVIGVDRLPLTPNDIYFLVMPNGMGSCQDAGPTNCALGGDAAGSYCGYHYADPEGSLLYAVIPYNAVAGHCQSGNPRPNASTADPTLSTISHEHNEVVTDPLGTGWVDQGSGSENGDLCVSSYGPALGGDGPSAFNQSIHGGHYYLQNEYSNQDHSCQAHDEPVSVSLSASARVSVGRAFRVSAQAIDPDGAITGYEWFFGQGRPGRQRTTSHTYTRAGTYRMVLRATDSSGNWAYVSTQIKAVEAIKSPAQRTRRPRHHR